MFTNTLGISCFSWGFRIIPDKSQYRREGLYLDYPSVVMQKAWPRRDSMRQLVPCIHSQEAERRCWCSVHFLCILSGTPAHDAAAHV